MIDVTISFPDDLKKRAEQAAADQGISLEAFILETVEQRLKELDRTWSEDPFLSDREVYDGPTPSDLVERHDDYLYGDKE